MSQRYNRDAREPLALVPFDEALLDSVAAAAKSAARGRSIVRFHEHGEHLQRMLNAIEPESYTRPHRHLDPAKPEAFVAMRGSVLVVRFGDDGAPLEGVLVEAGGRVQGVEVPAGAWHCLVSLQPGTVLFEVIQGPYEPTTHKEFAPWAPPEDDGPAGAAFIAGLRHTFEPLHPRIAALNRIGAEEDEIC